MEAFQPNHCQCSDNLKLSRDRFQIPIAIFLFLLSHKSTNKSKFWNIYNSSRQKIILKKKKSDRNFKILQRLH